MSQSRTIFTAGYGAGWTHDTLRAEMDRTGAALIDIRYSPKSRMPPWTRDALETAFGQRYDHLGQLGNRNYKGGPIALAAPMHGLEIIEIMLEDVSSVILLCGCGSHRQCHRSVVADLIANDLGGRWQIDIRHLYPPRHKAAGAGDWWALSIRPPWSHHVVFDGKDIENRTWGSDFRGPFLIHAAKTAESGTPPTMARGGIIGAAQMTDCVTESPSPWFRGPVGFCIADPQPLPFVPLRGQLGFFRVPAATLAPIAAELAALTWSTAPPCRLSEVS